jgi:hypothetical protein
MNPFKNLGPKAQQLLGDNKHWLSLILIAVALFGGGMAVGRYTLPAKVVTTEKVHEVVKDRIVEVVKTEVRVVEVKIHDSKQAEKVHRVTVEGIDPPGCKSKTVTEDINIDTVVHDNTNTNSTEIKYVDRVVEKWQDRIVEKTKTVLNQPNWRVAAGAGVAIPYFLGQGSPGVPGLQGAVINVEADRRIIGPFWLGIHGNTQGVVGLNLSGVF